MDFWLFAMSITLGCAMGIPFSLWLNELIEGRHRKKKPSIPLAPVKHTEAIANLYAAKSKLRRAQLDEWQAAYQRAVDMTFEYRHPTRQEVADGDWEVIEVRNMRGEVVYHYLPTARAKSPLIPKVKGLKGGTRRTF